MGISTVVRCKAHSGFGVQQEEGKKERERERLRGVLGLLCGGGGKVVVSWNGKTRIRLSEHTRPGSERPAWLRRNREAQQKGLWWTAPGEGEKPLSLQSPPHSLERHSQTHLGRQKHPERTWGFSAKDRLTSQVSSPGSAALDHSLTLSGKGILVIPASGGCCSNLSRKSLAPGLACFLLFIS